MLASGAVDLISQTVTISMERDINEQTSGTGFTFSYPFYFSGLVFGGLPEFVACADKLDPFTGICRQLKVCVVIGTTQEAILASLIGGSAVVRVSLLVLSLPISFCYTSFLKSDMCRILFSLKHRPMPLSI